MYRATPHAFTDKNPAFLMFRRNIRDGLPSLTEREEMLEVQDRDASQKDENVANQGIQDKQIEIGDEVLVISVYSELKNRSQSLKKKLALSLKFMIRLLKFRPPKESLMILS